MALIYSKICRQVPIRLLSQAQALADLQQTHDFDDPVTTDPATPDEAQVTLSIVNNSIDSNLDVDFGYRQQGSITGSVQEDLDGDGAGDQGIITTVELFADTDGDGNPDGAAIDSTTTAADGSYTFDDVPPGNYVVVETQPAGLVDVSDQDTTPDGDAFDGDTTVDNQVAVTVTPGETDTGNDFVDENQGSISGTVQQDTTGNGLGDTALAGVTVELFADTDGDGNPDGTAIDSMSTGSDGSYMFDNLSPGNYVVVETQPAGLIDVSDQDASPDGDAFDGDTTVDNQIASTVDPGEADTDNNFVEVNQGGISGNVGQDTTGNGEADTAIPGVIVELFADIDGDGNPDGTAIETTTTDANGNYIFPGVMPGNYVVVQTQPAGLNSIFDEDQSPDGDAFDGDTTVDNQIAVTVTSGELDDSNNFGEQAPASIEGQVLVDNDGDGTGDTGLGGVEIILQDDAGATVGSTTTAADGSYSFTGLTPGDYTVVETQPSGYLSVSDQDQSPDGDPQDADTTVDDQIGVLLIPGETDTGNDFVEEQSDICVACVDGVTNMTLKITQLVSWADPNERIRVRVGGLGGQVLYDSFNDSIPGNGIPVGTEFSFDVPASANNVVVTVQGTNHPSEYVKANFQTDCNLVIGSVSGNNYITIKVMDAQFDGDPDEDCLPKIDIRKQAEGADSRTFNPGDTVEFEIVVTNIGEFDLTNVVVDDPITPSCDRVIGNLAIGESFSYTCSMVLEGGSSASKTWLDNFSPAYSYSGNDGDTNFLGNWIENDPQGGDASSGRVLVGSNNKLWMNNYNYPGGTNFKPSARRSVDLSGMQTATLSFDWITHSGVDSDDAVQLSVKPDGGSWKQIAKFWGANTSTKFESYDVSAYISANTQFRFRVTNNYGGSNETFKVDNFKIVASGSGAPSGFVNVANVSGGR